MSLSNAFSGFGTRLQMGDGGGPEVFTDVAEVVEVNPPGLTSDTIDVTHHLSPLAFREFIASLSSAGTISITVNYIPSNPTHDATTGLHAAAISKGSGPGASRSSSPTPLAVPSREATKHHDRR